MGKPLVADLLTTRREIWSYARVLVEVDLSRPIRKTLDIHLSNGKTIKQMVEYERLPLSCDTCKQIGHSSSAHLDKSVEKINMGKLARNQ